MQLAMSLNFAALSSGMGAINTLEVARLEIGVQFMVVRPKFQILRAQGLRLGRLERA